MSLISENARRSLADEPGCRQFDVCTDPDDPERVFLYEVYDDRAAFEAHTRTPHFAATGKGAVGLVSEKTEAFYRREIP